MENHLRCECHRRLMNCEYCDKEIYFNELQVKIIYSI